MTEMTLNNNVIMPSVGIGTFLLEPKDAENSVKSALATGYRLIDTAGVYVNERAVGRGIKESTIKREDIFLSTKLWVNEYENSHAVDEALERLGTSYIDLLFVHQPAGNWKKGYENVVNSYKEGKIRAIGVSNFEGEFLDTILKSFDTKPQIIQAECHPFYTQNKLRRVTEKENIQIMSWFPLGGKGNTKELLDNDVIVSLATTYKKSPAQIVLKWHIQSGFIVIPGSKNPAHIRDNINLFDFELSSSDIKKIDSLNTDEKKTVRTKERLARYEAHVPIYEPKG